MDLSQLVNDLMDLELAAEHRFSVAAELTRTPPLRAELVLGAADHKAQALQLHDVVVELRGTPHAGETMAILADPLRFSPPVAGQGDRELLDTCLAEEETVAHHLETALRAEGLPHRAHAVVMRCIETSSARRRRLLELKALLRR